MPCAVQSINADAAASAMTIFMFMGGLGIAAAVMRIDGIFGYGVVPSMMVVVTVVRVSGHSTAKPDTSCTGIYIVFVFCTLLSVYVHVCLLCLCYDVIQSLPAFPVLLSTVLGAAITVPGRATAFGLDWSCMALG